MKKRVAGMAVISALVCGMIAIQAPQLAPQQTGSAAETAAAKLEPDTEKLTYEIEQPIGTLRMGVKLDLFTPATDYGRIFPYTAKIIGWKQDGTPVYRYALADEAGELLTEPLYSAAERQPCGETFVWLLTERMADGSTRSSCAAQDGSWVLGPFAGSITVEDDCIFVHRSGSTVSTVYRADGRIFGQVNGTAASCSDGIIVSRADSDSGTMWYISSADTTQQLAALQAVQVGAFSGGSATVQLSETTWGFVDASGKVTKTAASWMDETCGGYALAKDAAGHFGVLRADGEEIAAFTYGKGVHCGDELPVYQLWQSEQECIVLNAPRGQKLRLPDDLHGQQLTALPDSYFAYTNTEGNVVVFDDLEHVELKGEAAIYPQGSTHFIAALADGYQIFNKDERKVGKLHHSLYAVPQQQTADQDDVFTITDPDTGRQGIADVHGHVVIKPLYDSIVSADGTYFAAMRGGWSGIVDADGTWIVRTALNGAE